jgi:hypothetical protein
MTGTQYDPRKFTKKSDTSKKPQIHKQSSTTTGKKHCNIYRRDNHNIGKHDPK